MRYRWMLMFPGGALLWVLVAQPGIAQQAAGARPGTDWPMYRHDYAGTGYSPLTQIDTTNVQNLAQAWTYGLPGTTPTAAAASGRGGPAAPNSEATPIVVNGTMYLPAINRVVALEPETGKQVWQYQVDGGAPSRRGVAYWPGEGNDSARIIFTAGRRLIALNAKTGVQEPGFGKGGEVDLVIPYNSVPLVYKNVVVVGGNSPQGNANTPGNARGFDARSGAKLWELNTIAQPGDVGHDTWDDDSWKNRGGVNAWPFYFTLDEERGLVYVPTGAPNNGFYGGDRAGANLYANSVIAVDVQTGKYKWHFQTLHHDIWDADPAAPPGLVDIARNGRTVPALALSTKSGYLYILNRETGDPIFGVEERPVPKSDVPGEMVFPTQPFPLKPPPIARNSYKPEDLVTAADTTAEHAKACQELVRTVGGVYNAGPFTPWLYRAEGATTRSTLMFPGGAGGSNWGGTALDPRSGNVFLVTQDDGALGVVQKTAAGSPVAYERPGPERRNFEVPVAGGNWPCQKPPWGRLLAVNVSSGAITWQTRLGITEQLPAGRQNTGRPALAGPIVTAGGLIFVASTDDNRFRAFNARTGRELWVAKLDHRGNANPVTYQAANGKQYVAVVATDTLAVYALP